MQLNFHKMHGAGNDFILIDDRALCFPLTDTNLIRRLCERNNGIGSEGLILLQPAEQASFKMLFFNPDGHKAGMCGNGARCAALLAYKLKIAPDRMTFDTEAGPVQAEIHPAGIQIGVPAPKPGRLRQKLVLNDATITYHFIETGVPHTVIEIKNLENVNIRELGSALRRHEAFAPEGTNVDFMAVTACGSLRVRTYERGVEAETPACGTGIMACALVAGQLGLVSPPVKATCAHGDILEVNYELTAGAFHNVSLRGPAVFVFEGTLEI